MESINHENLAIHLSIAYTIYASLNEGNELISHSDFEKKFINNEIEFRSLLGLTDN